MRAIILAAGQGVVLDGMIKCLIRHPSDGRPLLEHALDAFAGLQVTVVVGYRAVEIMQSYPRLHYVFNEEWAVTNSAYSLALALDSEPCLVVSGDIFFRHSLVRHLLASPEDAALTSSRENRGLTAIHSIEEGGRLMQTYMGPLRSPEHDELLGLYKCSDPGLLRRWKEDSLHHGNLFNGQTLPVGGEGAPVRRMRLPEGELFHEINTVSDYMRFMDICR